MHACSADWAERLSAVFDGEAGAEERAQVARHTERCVGCRATLARFGPLRAGLQRSARAEVAVSPSLRARLERLEAPVRRLSPLRRVGMGMAAAAVLAVGLWAAVPHAGLDGAVALDAERHHLKAFARATPCDFASSDPEAVAGWLKAQMGHQVQVPDVPGAVLLGARRCDLAGESVPALLYRHGEDALTVYLPPADSAAAGLALRFARNGARCTEGPLGERICVSPRATQPALAVSAQEGLALAGVVGRPTP
ncbi:MAG: zf-HC2 domain-containing protein [Myxococcaceae bacterium]|nr:zf-HC2 domain-containing protein [Myxococcaceae bacterium]MCI0673323.1 zf-HC2 domain-containing protein [Myxococcaceae bacterium]